MDERRARVYDDLRGIVSGELAFEPLERGAYAHDASIHEIDPLGIVIPRTVEDVAATVRYAAENQIPLHARGAGTDTGGGALGPGLVIDFSQHLRRIVAIAEDRVVVEPGVVLDVLNAELASLGRRVEPVPLTSAVCTVGGMIGVDAAGARSLRYGSIGDHVERLRVVLAGGEVADLGFAPWPDLDSEPDGLVESIVRKLLVLHRRNGPRLARFGARAPRDRAGYALGRAAGEAGINLARLVSGSEGTLGLIVQATLRTVPLPPVVGVVLLPFARLLDAAGCVPLCLDGGLDLAGCDLFDWRSLRLARDADPRVRAVIEEAARSVLIVQAEGDDREDVSSRLELLADRLWRTGLLSSEARVLMDPVDCRLLLNLRKLVEPRLMKQRSRIRPVPVVDDLGVPIEELAAVVERLLALFKRHQLTWTLDAWAGDGRIRLRPFLDLGSERDRNRIPSIAEETYEIVLAAGGTISAAQGCGLTRTPFLPRQFGEGIQVVRAIKDAFDPANLFNPGKIVGDDPHSLVRSLKEFPRSAGSSETFGVSLASPGFGTDSGLLPIAGGEIASGRGLASSEIEDPHPVPAAVDGQLTQALRWPELDVVSMASTCHGCGECRILDPAVRMCPSFRAHRGESASPRAQANLIRQIAVGRVDPRLWGSDAHRLLASLCVHCKLCQLECPSGVDVSSLMIEAKAAYVENHGLSPGDWVFSRLEMWARLASRFPIVANFLMSRRSARWMLERMLGVSRHRVLPRVRRTPFTRRAIRMGLARPQPHRPGPRVVYFLDVFANYYDHELAEAVVSVLRLAGVNVFVPSRQLSSGMASLTVGDIDHARDLALRNLRILGDAVRDGFTVVCSEPTAALMLRQEYTKLTDDLDAELVAQNTMDVGQYLLGLKLRGQLPEPDAPVPVRVGYHQPCHLRALEIGMPGFELLRTVPGIEAEFLNRGCSGMGGTYGLRRDQFLSSLRAGRELLKGLRDDSIEIGATECGACRMQMEQGVTKRTLHPVKLLGLGYGLQAPLRRRLKEPKPRHAMS